MEPSSEWRTITPSEAETMLRANTGNRDPRDPAIDRLARDMQAGNWQLTGEAIKFASNGDLLDGQHRLMACVRAGVPFKTLVITGLPPESRENMDTQTKRTFGDYLRWAGEHNRTALASAVEAGLSWDTVGRPINHGRRQNSNAERMEWLRANPDIREAVTKAKSVSGTPLRAPTSIMAPFCMRATRISPIEADAFMESLKTGANLGEKDPIYRLRGWLIRAAEAKGQVRRVEVAAVVVKAWNYWLAGREITVLRWRSGGSMKEDFPFMETPDGRTYEEIITDPTYVPPGMEEVQPTGIERMGFARQAEPEGLPAAQAEGA